MNNRTKLHRKWHKELMSEWEHLGINVCEFGFDGCMRTFGNALAHSRKRRFIDSKEAYWEVGLACQKCHAVLDQKMTHEEMEQAVKDVINRRG